MVALWLPHLQEVAIGCTQSIGSIKELAHFFLLHMKHSPEHIRHLFLACIAITRNRHLYLRGCILRDGHLPLNGSSNCNALCTPQLEHTLYVLAEERRLDSHIIRQVALDDATDTLVNMTELEVRVGKLTQVNDAKGEHLSLFAVNPQYAVAHNVSARVYAKYNLFHSSAKVQRKVKKLKS